MKVYLAITILLAILAVGGVWFYSTQSKTLSVATTNTSAVPEQIAVVEEAPMAETTSRYTAYSPEVFASTALNRRVLFFYANWCPTCRPADADFNEKFDQIPVNMTVIRVNYNDDETDAEEKALAEKYQITYQHTFVQIDEQGNEITKWNGGQVAELLTRIQ